jgi:hypothetical protein
LGIVSSTFVEFLVLPIPAQQAKHADTKDDASQHESGLGGNLIVGFLVFKIDPKTISQDAQVADDADQIA